MLSRRPGGELRAYAVGFYVPSLKVRSLKKNEAPAIYDIGGN